MNTHIKTIIFVVGAMVGIVVGEVSAFSSEIGIVTIIIVITQLLLLVGSRSTSGGEEDTEHSSANVKWAVNSGNTVKGFIPLITILFCLGLFLGIIRVQLVEEKTNFVCESRCAFEAVIISSPETKNDYQVFKVSPIKNSENILDVQVRTPLYPKYKIGETLKLTGKPTKPNILFPHGNVRAFDYSAYLLSQNVGSEMLYPNVEVLDEEAHTLAGVLGRWKENLIMRIDKNVSAPASAFASGMLFGASSISKDLTQTFRTAGLSHIIVLSGFNIAIVIATILFILAFLPLIFRVGLASLTVIIFVMMVGGEPSVIRATLMAFIALVAMLVGREYVARSALIISLFLIIMYDPYALLHDVSLHLSFLATAGIVYFSEVFSNIFSRIKSDTLRGLCVTTISAYLATLPYVMYTFGTVSIYALFANILALPLVPISMLMTFFVVLFSHFSNVLAIFFGFVDTLLINIIIWIAQIIELLPFSYLSFTISFKTMCILYIVIVLLISYFSKRSTELVTRRENILTDIIKY